jgi:hypothetical protein
MNRGQDRDDWFAGAEPDENRVPDSDLYEDAGEDWMRDVPAPTRPWFETIDRRVFVLAAIGIALLIAILAAAGVFSSSPAPITAPPVTSTTTGTTSTTQTTTTSQSPPVLAPSATLKPGDTGTQVKVLQRALARLGFFKGTVDGDYGPATQAAVNAFQTSNGLTADGVVGPATLTALTTALNGA